MAQAAPCESVFAGNHFRIQLKSFFTLPWREYCIEHRSGAQLGFATRKYRTFFNPKIDIRVYSDETESTELFSIKQRSTIEWVPNYEVVDPTTGQLIGVIRRDPLRSFAAKEWLFVSALGQELGKIRSKMYYNFLFTTHHFYFEFGTHEAEIATEVRKNPYAPKISLDLSAIPVETLDRRLAIAFGLLVLANYNRT
jgi:hypothetical protein